MDEKKRKLALRAHSMSLEGVRGKAAGEMLGVSTSEANTLALLGADIAMVNAAALTPAEVLLIRCIATVTRRLRGQGAVRTPKSWEVAAAAGKSESWVGATSRKRLRLPYQHLMNQPDQPLGLVDFTTNGYVGLTVLGWAFVQALDAAEEAAKNPLLLALTRARDAIQDVVSGECNTERGDDLVVLQALLKELNARLPTA